MTTLAKQFDKANKPDPEPTHRRTTTEHRSAQRAGTQADVHYAAGNLAIQRLFQSNAQAKFSISQPGDVHEREADRMADQVVAPSSPHALHKGRSIPAASPRRFLQDLGPGLPLDASNRALMEARFGTNFGHVRVHTDAQAAESARMMNAKAFTLGQDIVFGTGQYALETITGKRLLAHELTHVIQQRVGNNQIIQRQPDGSDSADTWKPVDDSIMQVWIHAEIEEAGGETQVEKLKNAWYDTLRKRKENPKDLNYVALEHYMHVRGSVAEGGYLKYAGFRLATPAYEILKAGIGEKSSQELRTDENDEVSPASYDVFKWGMIAAQDGLWDYRKGGSSYCCRWSSAAQP